MGAKELHKKRLLTYLEDWDNPFPNRTEMAKILGVKLVTLYYHFTPAEINEILNEGIELRKKNSAVPRSEIYLAMLKEAKDGAVPAQKEFLDRTEGKVVDRHEHTGKDGKELFPTLSPEDKALLANISKREPKQLAEKPSDDSLEGEV